MSAQAQVRWNFTDGDAVADQTIANLANTPTITRVNGGASTLVDSTSPSNYAGASGTNNIQAGAVAGALNPASSTYFEFTLSPNAGFAINATGLQLGSRATSTGPTTITLRSSIDGFVADLAIVSQAADSTWRLLTLPGFNITGDTGVPVTFRIYGSGGTSASAGNWRVDDITLTATAIPEPGTYMLLASARSCVCSGSVARISSRQLTVFERHALNVHGFLFSPRVTHQGFCTARADVGRRWPAPTTS
jgi:hypothetical protein